MKKVIIGIDGGGTYSRVVVVDKKGNFLSYINKKGGASIHKDHDAEKNVHCAIKDALNKAGKKSEDVLCISAGIAGYDGEEDLEWVSELTNIEGLSCAKYYLNDAKIAHIGAFISKTGIIVIAGTGCVIFGITENEVQIKNYDFEHQSQAHARGLSYEAIYRIIAGNADDTDGELVSLALDYFKVSSISELALLGSKGFKKEKFERNKFFGDFAPIITEQALKGSHIAQNTCNLKAENIVMGIKLVGACFSSDTISVSLVGSVANSIYVKGAITNFLSNSLNKNYEISTPMLPAVLGAVVNGMEKSGIEITLDIINNLHKSAKIITNEF